MYRLRLWCVCLLSVLLVGFPSLVSAQGVTTGSLTGRVTSSGAPVSGATVVALHVESGSRYSAVTRDDGRYSIPNMRVGGPYRVTVSRIGLERVVQNGVFITLGEVTPVDATMRAVAVQLEQVSVTANADALMSGDRTGAATTITRENVSTLPGITGRLESVVRLTPQAGGGGSMSFVGQDNRLNNITVDGSYFNNSFGLGGTPGDRTGVAPISLAAIEQVQVNVAPFDVRQGNFVGANINTVTRSGTNDLRGSIGYSLRNQNFIGTQAGSAAFNPGMTKYHNLGGWVSGPIIKNRLFYFFNYENDEINEPGTTYRANTGGETPAGSITRVNASDLDALSTFLRDKFNYETGPYQGYNSLTPSTRLLGKLDFNLNDRNKLSVRYNQLDSKTDVLESTSSSLGFGARRSNLFSLNYQNSNYQILENIKSLIGEWNSTLGNSMANNLIAGYTTNDESRASRGTFFPLVDILESGRTYTSFGFEPFTPNNELRYHTFQLQDNFSIFRANHSFTFGASLEKYRSENVFFPGSQSVYVYNSLADFYTDANDFLANPARTTSPVTLRSFQVRWSNIPGLDKPLQPLDVLYTGVYAQDEWSPRSNLKITAGIRADVPKFGNTAYTNALADQLTFQDENRQPVQYQTGKLPDPKLLISPRIGFNWDVRSDRTTQLRGGTGVFTGKPAFVWISNQIGNTGVLTGFEDVRNTTARPFNPDPNAYKPANVTGQPASSYELALTDPNFKFPQVWRSDIAVDKRLPWNLVGTAEVLYSRDVNGVSYINANLAPANTSFSGADTRPRWTASNRLNANVSNATVLKNEGEGYSWNFTTSLERGFRQGLFVKAAYNYGIAKNTVDAGSIAFGSWNGNAHPGDPNNPGLGYSANSPGHRLFLATTLRGNPFKIGNSTVSLFSEMQTIGRASYVYSGDLNGDGGFSNDLLYVPASIAEMNFQTYTTGSGASAVTFTADQQAQAWEAYIQQDEYLRSHRGQYVERNGVQMPMVFRSDLSFSQDLTRSFGGRVNGLQFRIDILNVGNLLNHNWGIGQRFVTTSPLIVPSSTQGGPADAGGRAQYRLNTVGNKLIDHTFEPTANLADVYRFQLSVRYNFN